MIVEKFKIFVGDFYNQISLYLYYNNDGSLFSELIDNGYLSDDTINKLIKFKHPERSNEYINRLMEFGITHHKSYIREERLRKLLRKH